MLDKSPVMDTLALREVVHEIYDKVKPSISDINDKLVKIVILLLFRNEEMSASQGSYLAKILINHVFPKIRKEYVLIEDDDEDSRLIGIDYSQEMEIYHYGLTQVIADCVICKDAGYLTSAQVKIIIDDCWNKYCGYDLIQYLRESKLLDVPEGSSLLILIKEAMAANPKAISEYKAGKEKALGAIVGTVMKKQKGINSVDIQTLIKKELENG